MLDNYQHIAYLITGFNNGTLTEVEHDELDVWITTSDKNQQLFEELTDPEQLKVYLKQMEGYNQEEVFQKIKTIAGLPEKQIRRIFPFKKIAVAASIILAIGIGSYLLFFNKTKKEEIVKLPETKDVEAPKGTKAMITLVDGRTISVDSLTTIDQSSVKLTKTSDGKIIYSGTASQVIFNTLSNPRGSKVIDMTLSDGSHVWLNAGSSIIYPVAFIGNERKVTIEGEAYFEVAKDPKKIFSVVSRGITTEVTGTHFNVNNYEDEGSIRVTLLEGSVNVFTNIVPGAVKTSLRPGEQAEAGDIIRVNKNVDVEQVIAWKNGYFQFGNTSLQDLMKQLSRWYDIDIVYQSKVPVREFGGEISREANLSQVLKILNESKVKCRIEGRKLIIE